jgi:predicted MFS family arabinose efflux permease
MARARLGLLSPLSNPAFGRLFAARTIALVGSGLTTIALALLAYDLVGGQAGFVLGTALALKMIAYVGVAPIVGGLADRLPRRALLIALDLARAVLVLGLVLVSVPTEIYLPIFLLNACSAGFTPTFQAAIPDLLRDSAEYTKGLALSRVTYDLESLLSPSLSTLALLLVGYPAFFVMNSAAFVLSALLIGTTRLPAPEPSQRPTSVRYNLSFGVRSYLATPRLRGLLALCTAVSLAGAMVIVNTVVLVRDRFGGSDVEVALAFAASGAGSLAAALATPALLRYVSVRTQMLYGSALLPVGLVLAAFASGLSALLLAWIVIGSGMSLVQTAAGRVIEASCNAGDRPAFFSAHFSLSHAAWLFAYPLAGWVGAAAGMDLVFWLVTVGTVLASVVAVRAWPAHDPELLSHTHEELEHLHLHGIDAHHAHAHPSSEDDEPHAHRHRHGPLEHAHRFVIDAHHRFWPR